MIPFFFALFNTPLNLKGSIVNLFVVITGSAFAIFSAMILAYVSMVTSIGPWIAPTLVLVTSVLLKMRKVRKPQKVEEQEMALAQTAGNVGGIVAVAIGFTLPTLYFLDPNILREWIASPLYFCALIGAATISAGSLGMYLAKRLGEKFVYKDKLKFPVSLLVNEMITSQSQGKQVKDMLTGLFSTGAFCFIRDGMLAFKGFLPRSIDILPSIFGRELSLALYTGPTLWAVGFTTGAVIAIPLVIGMLSKYLVLYPINHHSIYLPFKIFEIQSTEAFTMAFCSGLVVAEALFGIHKYPKIIWNSIRGCVNYESLKNIFNRKKENSINGKMDLKSFIELAIVLIVSSSFLFYLHFSFVSQIVVVGLTLISTYQISLMGAKIGMIPFGRFATFVMIPTMLLFKIDYVQITFLCIFVNVCSAVASDLLFDYKVGELCAVSFKNIRRYQWLGLIITAICIGFLFWLLFTNFQIGSPELFAQRGKARALLIQSTGFNYWVLLMGAIYGLIIKQVGVSPALVLGGLLMPNSLSIGLILGGLVSRYFKQPDKYFPFWSGVLAGESIWILLTMLLKLVGI